MPLAAWIAVVAGLLLAGWLLDRLALWAEARGWIYWRRRQPSSSARSAALHSVSAFLEPTREHVVEEQQRQEADIDVAGDAGDDAPPR